MNGRTRLHGLWLAALAVVAVGLAACSGGGSASSDTIRGALVTDPITKPDIVLTDTSGKPYDIRKETAGAAVTLIYVGYTHCPDVCPTHMADMRAVFAQLPPDTTSKIRVLFITADPERDTPAVLKEWLALFDSRFIGLTGSRELINNVQEQLGLKVGSKQYLANGVDYTVSHAAYVMAFTRDNQAHVVYPLGVSRTDWVHDLMTLVKEGWKS
jgi:protein SCO1/2